MSRQDHAAPILARLAPATVYDGAVPNNTTPPVQYYVVRFAFRKLTAGESPSTTSLSFDSVTYQVDVTVHSVGPDSRSIRGMATYAEAQLLNWTPTVTGRSCSPLRQIDGSVLPVDEAMGVPVEQAVDVYRFKSSPG